MDESERQLRVLVVEDETHLAAGLKLNFELEGFAVDVASSARQAGAFLLNPQGYDVVILDVMLPDVSGFDLCRRMRDSGDFTPVIMLTARGLADDRTHGLNAGADDYLPKPFELSELLARVRSLLRRQRWDSENQDTATAQVLRFGNAVVDFDTHSVQVGARQVKLTQLELDLVRYFAANAQRVIGRGELLEKVWKIHNYPNTRTVDNFIARLRKHFEADPTRPVYFISVRGSGYKFVPR